MICGCVLHFQIHPLLDDGTIHSKPLSIIFVLGLGHVPKKLLANPAFSILGLVPSSHSLGALAISGSSLRRSRPPMAVAKDIITNVLRTSLLRFIKDASGDQCPGGPQRLTRGEELGHAWGMISGVRLWDTQLWGFIGLEDMIVVDY